MIGRSRPAILLAAFVLSACSVSVIRHGKIDQAEVHHIERGVAKLRGLSFRSAVPMEVESTDKLRAGLKAELERQYSSEEIAGLGRVYKKLRLLPSNADLAEELLKLYTSQVAGFYDPWNRKLYLVDVGLPAGGWMMSLLQFVLRRDIAGEMVLAHELTHALQDQNFSVLGLANDPTNEDRELAAAAVLEGDATLSGFSYVFGGLPEQSLLDIVERLQAIPLEVAATLPDTPPALREALIFRYTAGSNFVAWAYLRGGWSAVNALLVHPPTSSEQLLWPEKYFVDPDDPTEIQLGGLEPYRSGAEWSSLEENTLGELMIRVQAQGFLDAERAIELARGWDGDRFVAFARGKELRVFWMSIWDSERDAAEFFQGEREILGRNGPSGDAPSKGSLASTGGAEPACVERRAEKVLIALGIPPEQCAASMEPVWAKTTFVQEPVSLNLDLARAGR